jgi:hypothetical protein
LKNNLEIFHENQLTDLHIDRVERNDSGLYTCIVYNRFYNNQITNGSSTIEVIVQSRPIIETTYSKIAAEIDQSIILTCRVFGEPKANIIWKFNEQIIQCDEIKNEICYLRFSKITKKDFGAYQCIAENLLGKEEWTYYIVSRGKNRFIIIRKKEFAFFLKVNQKHQRIFLYQKSHHLHLKFNFLHHLMVEVDLNNF